MAVSATLGLTLTGPAAINGTAVCVTAGTATLQNSPTDVVGCGTAHLLQSTNASTTGSLSPGISAGQTAQLASDIAGQPAPAVGGDLAIAAGHLSISGPSTIAAVADASGAHGVATINVADEVALDAAVAYVTDPAFGLQSGISALTLTLTAGSLSVVNGAIIEPGSGGGGTATITVGGLLDLDGGAATAVGAFTGIPARNGLDGVAGGSLAITAGSL